jgi:hypothetical protein
VAVGSSGEIFVSGHLSRNVFRIAADGSVAELIDSSGDGATSFYWANDLVAGPADKLYVSAETTTKGQVFEIDTAGGCSTSTMPPCPVAAKITSSGDGVHGLGQARGLARDSLGNLYVAGFRSNNVFRIAPNGSITEIADSSGDGTRSLDRPFGLAVDQNDNLYVSCTGSDNVFRIEASGNCGTARGAAPCPITEVIDGGGDGSRLLIDPGKITTDSSGNVFVTGQTSQNVFRLTQPTSCSTSGTPCTIVEIAEVGGDGNGNTMLKPFGVATDGVGNVYVADVNTHHVFGIAKPDGCSTSTTPCHIVALLDSSGDGNGNTFGEGQNVAASYPNVYVVGRETHNAFRIDVNNPIFDDGFETGDNSLWSGVAP